MPNTRLTFCFILCALSPAKAQPQPISDLSAYQRSLLAKVASGEEEGPSWRRTRAQGVLLGRMFASEDGRSMRRVEGGGTCGELTSDHYLVARTVTNNARSRSTFRGWDDVMRWLSPNVTRSKELSKPRQEWTSTLPARGDAMPEGWIDARSVEDPKRDYNHGDWRVHGPCWVVLRKNAIKMWLDGPPFGDFGKDVKPSRWGNEGDVLNFFSERDKKGRLTKEAKRRRKRFCVLSIPSLNFFIARDGKGCRVGDEATLLAYEGKKPD